MLMVASETDGAFAGAHQYLEKAGENVTAIWLDGVNQFDFYDQPKAVEPAIEAITSHFQKKPALSSTPEFTDIIRVLPSSKTPSLCPRPLSKRIAR